eukprot:6385676-Karenia_brevis.AAC.1
MDRTIFLDALTGQVNVPVQSGVLHMWERMFDDEDSKDVNLIGSDGAPVRVHSCVLSNTSDVFKCMLQSPMKEGKSKDIKLDSFSATQLRFITRLLYTGQHI